MTPQDAVSKAKQISQTKVSLHFALSISFLIHFSFLFLLLKRTKEVESVSTLEISFVEKASENSSPPRQKSVRVLRSSAQNEKLKQTRRSSQEFDLDPVNDNQKASPDSEVTDLSQEISDLSGLESPLQKYLRALRRRIEIQKNYPLASRKLKEEGLVKVVIALSQNGSVLEAHLAEAAPYERLNEAAMLAIKKAAPFDEFPVEVQKEKWIISVPIRFSLQR